MAQSLTSFVNHNWTFNSVGASINSFPKAGLEVEIYNNNDFANYVAFLSDSEASSKIDEDVPYLT